MINSFRLALPDEVSRGGWRKATQPLTSTHFDPTIFLDFRKNVVVLHRANEPIYLVYGISFRARLKKGSTGGHDTLQG